MKATVYSFIIVFVFSIIPFNSYSNVNNTNDENSKDQLFFMGSKQYIFVADPEPFEYGINVKMIPPEEFAFTGDDILSYNLTNKEIVFNESVYNNIINNYQIYNIYINDNLLLENIFVTRDINSWVVTDLVLFHENKFYLCYEHPQWHEYMNRLDDFPEDEREMLKTIQKRIDERRKESLDIFIKYLNRNNKIITGIDDVKTELPIQIYSTGKSIHINNATGNNSVITVYRIDGTKIAEQTTTSQTTTMNVPVSGFYIVSVKAENEKSVVAKLVVR